MTSKYGTSVDSEIYESACRRFSIARSNPRLNAVGYGIQ